MKDTLKYTKEQIQKIYKKYSFKDICNSLFILSSWLPNISATVKPSFLFLCLFEILDYEFKKEDKIKKYSDFKSFFSKIKTFIPEFIGMEDYFPENDWGDVFYYIDGDFYKYLYGGELENTYDHIKYFEFYHGTLSEDLYKITNQNPKEDLKKILKLQNLIIESITNNDNESMDRGYFELPNENFWNECNIFLYSKLNIFDIFDTETLDWYSQKEPISKEILKDRNFCEAVMTGNAITSLFIKKEDEYYLLPLRRIYAVLLDKWNKIIFKNIKQLETPANNILLKKQLNKFLYSKISMDYDYFENISLIQNNKPDSSTIEALLVHENRILLILLQELCEDATMDSAEHLTKINQQIKKYKDILSKNDNLKFIIHNKLVEFETDPENNIKLEMDFIVIHPSLTTTFSCLGFKEELNFKLFNYTDFIQFIDEIRDVDDLFKKFDYTKKGNKKSFSSNADLISFFSSENEGEILTGCHEYSHIFLDPFYSDKTRYQNLKSFWELSPKEILNNIEPRNWLLEKMENSDSLYMYSLHFSTFAICCKLDDITIFINTLPRMDSTHIDGIKIFSEMLEDAFTRYKDILKEHLFFKSNKKLQILVIPEDIVTNKQINELTHLLPKEEIWMSDIVQFKGCKGIRIVFDKEKLFDNLMNIHNRTVQIKLFIEIINKINKIYPDALITKSIVEKSLVDKEQLTRFMVYADRKETCFPVRHSNIYPQQKDFIKTQNIMAKILHEANITSRDYDLDKAKYILDTLKNKLIEYINDEVRKYNFKTAIPMLIEYNDANINTYEMKDKRIRVSLQHEVDYSREDELTEAHEKFLREAANYRYLIEKFVQINPNGNKRLDEDDLSFLLSLVDWLIITYRHSDSIHYNLLACGLIVKDDKSIETIFKDNYSEKEDQYASIEVTEQLYKSYENINFTSYMKYHEEFCMAFKEDFGFNFQNMINILTVLSQWIEDDSPYIIASEVEIIKNAIKSLKDYSVEEQQEVPLILDFLTLKQGDITKILNKNDFCSTIKCEDIPLDEFNLRYCRYTIKPLIKYENKFIWGPYSAQKTGMTFCKHIQDTRMPYNLKNSKSLQILEKIKKIHEKELVKNTCDILSQYTQFIDKEVELHKRDKAGNHPLSLGDYDVLAYLPNENILLNIECKHHLGAYSPKDARKYLDKMYEPDKSRKSAIDRVINREQYISENYQVALDILKTNTNNKPEVLSLYVTKIRTFYIMFPKEKTNTKLLSIYDLENYISSLITNPSELKLV
jgi:hypothetical protein